jgi:hypothetical protein
MKKADKIKTVMKEFKSGTLHSGSKKGPKVTSPKQAIAIALNQSRTLKKADGGMAAADKQQAATSVLQDASKVGFKKGGWIQDAIKKPGALRKSLGVKEGAVIPKGKLKSAANSSNPTTARRANLAMTLRKLGK